MKVMTRIFIKFSQKKFSIYFDDKFYMNNSHDKIIIHIIHFQMKTLETVKNIYKQQKNTQPTNPHTPHRSFGIFTCCVR
ncbi:hypothetical protein Avbf_12057 [Armadillidium vulgare]|nr:hypothetical protein Avbf_12057 [Armadillidium vulgare]